MKVLITGAPGWLGNRWLELLGEGNEPGWPTLPNLQLRALVLPGVQVPADGSWNRVEVVRGDVCDPKTIAPAVVGVDAVLHMAGIIHPKRISDLYAINTQGTRHLLDAALMAGVRRFVYISSNSAAGTNVSRERLMAEEDPCRPYLNYGRSKYLAEQAVREAGQVGRMDTVILRPCWYYGPCQPQRQTRFFTMMQQGHPILFGDGSNLRSMTYLDNLCQAIVLSLTVERAAGETYWIADERPYPTLEVYETIARLLQVKGFKPRRVPALVSEGCLMADRVLQGLGLYVTEIHVAGEMNKDIACSIEKAKRELGYRPLVALEEGMRRSIEWCRAHGISV